VRSVDTVQIVDVVRIDAVGSLVGRSGAKLSGSGAFPTGAIATLAIDAAEWIGAA
jgi:hypothetical protein